MNLTYQFLIIQRRRQCKAGFGVEETKNECDTPGCTHHDHPYIALDHKKSQKLNMPRNHSRVVQTSEDILRVWRGNCDIQILIYNSSPDNLDTSEIARVTDYVVAYSCKGNKTLTEEREQNRNLILKYVSI